MASSFQDLQRFLTVTVIVYPLCGLLTWFMWRAVRHQTKTPRPAANLRMFALWLIFPPLLLYVLQFVFPPLTVYFLCLPFGMIVIHLYFLYAIEKNDFIHPESLAAVMVIHLIALGVCSVSTFPLTISRILLAFTSLDPSLVDFLGYSTSFAWCMLDGFAIWLYGKKKQWDVYPPFYIEKRKPQKARKKLF